MRRSLHWSQWGTLTNNYFLSFYLGTIGKESVFQTCEYIYPSILLFQFKSRNTVGKCIYKLHESSKLVRYKSK